MISIGIQPWRPGLPEFGVEPIKPGLPIEPYPPRFGVPGVPVLPIEPSPPGGVQIPRPPVGPELPPPQYHPPSGVDLTEAVEESAQTVTPSPPSEKTWLKVALILVGIVALFMIFRKR